MEIVEPTPTGPARPPHLLWGEHQPAHESDMNGLAQIWFNGCRRNSHLAVVPAALARLRTLGEFSRSGAGRSG